MKNNIIGKVISVKNGKVDISLNEISSQIKYYFEGEVFDGPQIGTYLMIKHSNVYIIVEVESENIEYEKRDDNLNKIKRILCTKILGYADERGFYDTPKFSPIVFADVFLTPEKISKLVITDFEEKEENIEIGETLSGLKYKIPINGIFNSHFGIFGNTGSGKSNTLTKLYSELFEKYDTNDSEFIFIDFNGEYTKQKVLTENKTVCNFSTRNSDGEDKIEIEDNFLWNSEIMSVLFNATEKTQKPFLERVIDNRDKYFENDVLKSINTYFEIVEANFFASASINADESEIFKTIIKTIGDINGEEYTTLFVGTYYNKYTSYAFWGNTSDPNERRKIVYNTDASFKVEIKKSPDFSEELLLRVQLCMLSGMLSREITYEYVKYLINKIKTSTNDLKKVVKIRETVLKEKNNDVDINTKTDGESSKNSKKNIKVFVYSLRKCNQNMKKIIPLLIAKKSYEEIKRINDESLKTTKHLIIDEAHNILSYTSKRESEHWKDYRLEVFEELIKEGRKFGLFLTIASQRPGDISDTVISQLHNYFIHRLVNENDLLKLKNQLSELGSKEFNYIPRMGQGMCIIAGVAIRPPKIIQIDYIKEKELRPNSDDAELFGEVKWKKKKKL